MHFRKPSPKAFGEEMELLVFVMCQKRNTQAVLAIKRNESSLPFQKCIFGRGRRATMSFHFHHELTHFS